MKEVAFKAQSISKSFGYGAHHHQVLHDISFDLQESQLVFLTGPSGSGKTTLLMTMGLIIQPDQGHLEILHKKITYESDDRLAVQRASKIGFVFQFSSLIDSINIIDNLLLTSGINGNPVSEEQRKRAGVLLDFFELGEYAAYYPHELSGGQKQRIAIIRAMMNNPPLLLCDEPVSGLDYKNAVLAIETLHDISKLSGKTVVVSIHDERFIPYADRILELENGKLVNDKRVAQ